MLYEVFVDGASRGQGQVEIGEAACAVVIYKNRKLITQYARPLGRRTNNEAEYEAVITALLMCASDPDIKDPIIYSDSLVVVNHVNGKWKCNDTLFPLLTAVRIVKQDYRFRLIHTKRKDVHTADALVNKCLDHLEEEKKAYGFKTKFDKEVITWHV